MEDKKIVLIGGMSIGRSSWLMDILSKDTELMKSFVCVTVASQKDHDKLFVNGVHSFVDDWDRILKMPTGHIKESRIIHGPRKKGKRGKFTKW